MCIECQATLGRFLGMSRTTSLPVYGYAGSHLTSAHEKAKALQYHDTLHQYLLFVASPAR
eukprot:2586219-Rhodomonas_salina.1